LGTPHYWGAGGHVREDAREAGLCSEGFQSLETIRKKSQENEISWNFLKFGCVMGSVMSAPLTGTPEADRLRVALHSVAGVFDLAAGMDRSLRDIPVAQRRCLALLTTCEGATMQELAARLGAKAPAMSQIIDRLARRDLVERHTDKLDRRVCRLHLTPAGRSLVQRAREGQDQRLTQALETLDPGLRDNMLRGLQALVSYRPLV
jgi:DNA-binding MarR family transcriptional regulator